MSYRVLLESFRHSYILIRISILQSSKLAIYLRIFPNKPTYFAYEFSMRLRSVNKLYGFSTRLRSVNELSSVVAGENALQYRLAPWKTSQLFIMLLHQLCSYVACQIFYLMQLVSPQLQLLAMLVRLARCYSSIFILTWLLKTFSLPNSFKLATALSLQPHFLQTPCVHLVSGFFGPIAFSTSIIFISTFVLRLPQSLELVFHRHATILRKPTNFSKLVVANHYLHFLQWCCLFSFSLLCMVGCFLILKYDGHSLLVLGILNPNNTNSMSDRRNLDTLDSCEVFISKTSPLFWLSYLFYKEMESPFT